MTNEEIKKVLELHKKWLNNEEGGVRANLRAANLRGVDLRGANLSYANLSYAFLRDADLSCADLSYANLRGVDLRGADLTGANLSYAFLRDVDLSCANLRGVDLRGANLSYAFLRDANLRGADLRGADLRGAILIGANLEGANLDEKDKPLPESETDVFVGEVNQELPAIIPYELYHEIIHSGELANKCGKNLTQAIFKMMEELGELTSSLEAMGSYKKGKIEDVHEEIMDVLQCATSIYVIAQKEHAFDGAAILKAKNDKWEKLYLKKKEVKE